MLWWATNLFAALGFIKCGGGKGGAEAGTLVSERGLVPRPAAAHVTFAVHVNEGGLLVKRFHRYK